jgi:hypothetical protein
VSTVRCNDKDVFGGREQMLDRRDSAAILLARHLPDGTALNPIASTAQDTLNRKVRSRVTALGAAPALSRPSTTELVQRRERRCLAASAGGQKS